MKVYIKFISSVYFKSLFFVFFVITSLVFILNLLTEIEFFKDENINVSFTLFLSLLNSPALVFEIFPFIILLTVQLFFIKFFENKELDIFRYSGLKNSNILIILGVLTLITGIFLISVFYNVSSTLKSVYLELKSNYTSDGKYLAVVTKNGLWIKDKVDNKIIITNSSSIENKYLINNFITEFDENFNVIRNIQSDKIDITEKKWIIFNARVYQQNDYRNISNLEINTNFNSERIQTLYSNLSALTFIELYELRKNYKKLNYSITDLDLHMLKLISNPVYLLLITIFASLIMFRIKQIKSSTFKISIGLFFSVIIYYFNNFSYVLGSTERISLLISIFFPLIILTCVNGFLLNKVNDK
ncbi:LptF/LptG family permease [Candidatus Pelagibacter sp.]|uniref:LptF/LptG family permease n=1 Tax=Candidatus Pelagibacter sp. TaxID=2024849 RepID=UPI003F82D75D